LKFSSKSGSFPYTLLFCQVILFSFAAAFGATWLFRAPAPAEKPMVVHRQQLFQNYRILNYFLTGAAPTENGSSDTADPVNPLLAAIANLKQAQVLLDEKKYAASAAALEQVPDRFPFVAARRDSLRLQNLHAAGRFREFIAYADAHASGNVDLRVMRLDSLLRDDRRLQALGEFKALFARQPLAIFSRRLSGQSLASLLQALGDEDWTAKFALLLKNNEGNEFRRELAYSSHRDLNRLFRAEFAYHGRAYAQARQLLRAPFPERYRSAAADLLLKLDVRENPGLDLEERLRQLGGAERLAPALQFDLAQILLGRGEFAQALPLYERYLKSSREHDEEYWKTVWLLAWIHYRQDDKERALAYFRLGGDSTVPGYRIASRYWQYKLENGAQPQLAGYPFSYYAVKVLGDKESFKNLHLGFLCGIDDPPSHRFLEIVEDLKVLARNGLWDEAAEAIHWAKGDPGLGACDLNLLKIIESLLYYQQNHYFMAFDKFRGNFRYLESVRLPNFLSGIIFPRQYQDLVAAYSREHEVDPGLVLALIREESFFRSDVRSPANAYGLMQLLHGTARQVADGSGLKVKAKDLYDPEINIRLGLQYLKTLLDKYDGRLYLALAAYNAGPHRVDQWLQDFPDADEEEFIEMIPFSETRNYVKNILRNYFFYKYYYDSGKV
jgi:hypothetical protein